MGGCVAGSDAGEAPRSGQLLFIPVQELGPFKDGFLGHDIALRACEEVDGEGLRVSGRVMPTSGVIEVLVTGPRVGSTDAGIRVGLLEQLDSGVIGALPGDFDVVLPWADLASIFAIRQGREVLAQSPCPDPAGRAREAVEIVPGAASPPRAPASAAWRRLEHEALEITVR